MNQMVSNKVLPGSNKQLKDVSFLAFYIALITVLIAFNTCEKPQRVIQLTTLEALPADISFTSATLKGEITDLGSAPIEDHGILVSVNSNPRIGSSNVVSLGKCSSRGGFQVRAENLVVNTTYYFWAFVSVNGEDIYSEPNRQFKTKGCNPATVTTTAVSSVTTSSALTGGNISADGGAPVTARGVCWSTSSNPVITADTTVDGAGTGSFSSAIIGLTNNTTYHVRAYAINAAGPAYGNDVFFTTSGIPVVSTSSVTSITASSATTGGNVTSDRGAPVTARGVCWSTTLNPTTDNPFTSNGTGTGQFTSNITGLTFGTTYHVRAYATNSAGTAYGEDVPFTTAGFPTVTTSTITLITSVAGTSGGNVIADGGVAVTVKGVCWSTSVNPTIANSITSDGNGKGAYTSNITGLTPGTIYHVRAYATNSVGTVYGDDIPFRTLSLPTITTSSFSSLTSTSVESGGNVTYDGGATVTARGVCWSTSPNPTADLSTKTVDGSGQGPFISEIKDLTTGTSYHVRAYASNSVGTAYGTDLLFTTLSIPQIITTDISAITPTTAKSGGNITSDGGTSVTARGVCWNTTGGPTINDYKSADGPGTGVFTSDLTGLTQTTVYYVRSFATNIVGTAYGNEIRFTTDFLCGTRFLDRRDNKTYWTTKIGNQCWFAENLNVGTLVDGSVNQTNNGIIEKYCYDNLESNCNVYGGLYQWDEIMQYTMFESPQGVCPAGWHVPSDNEWKILEMTLGMSQSTADLAGWRGTTEGGKLKATGTAYWQTPNEGATNSSLFTALPSGNRTNDGIFEGKGVFTDFWTSTFLIDNQCLYRLLNSTYSQIYRVDGYRFFATPIRCVRN